MTQRFIIFAFIFLIRLPFCAESINLYEKLFHPLELKTQAQGTIVRVGWPPQAYYF